METYYQNQILDSPSKNSYIGSYYQPPDRLLAPLFVAEAPPPLPQMNPVYARTTPDAGSKAVIAALKTLQEKIRRLELERKQAERNVQQFSQAAHGYEARCTAEQEQPPSQPEGTDGSKKRELVTQLQSAEARCQLLEKQLEYMRKMVENAVKDKNALTERQRQVSLQRQALQNSSDAQTQQDKLDKLERDCCKLNKTQSAAERKIELLEQKLLEEEHERKLVKEKADELMRELETNRRPAVSEETKTKRKKSKTATRKSSTGPPSFPKAKQLPFVAGTSTSPSHSVHANMQCVLHMMKHHQPQLCERVRCLRSSGAGARRGLHQALSSSTSPPGSGSGSGQGAPALGSLSDLLLALQDELGQMSFEHQELARQIDEARQREHREDLERELEVVVRRMEEKGAQITKLRTHQHTYHKMTQKPQKSRRRAASEDGRAKEGGGRRGLPPSPVRTTQGEGRSAGVSQQNLQLLRETQKLRSSLKQDDIIWES